MFRLKLKELRERAGYSQYSFAEAFGVAQSTVGGWESGKREPKFETMQKIADFFGVSVDYLLGRDTKKSTEIQIPESSQNEDTQSNSIKVFTTDEMRKISLSIVKKMSDKELENLIEYFTFVGSDEYELCMRDAKLILKNAKVDAQLESDYWLCYALAYLISGSEKEEKDIKLLTELFK